MKTKIKSPKIKYKDCKLITTVVYYQQEDDFGELIRKSEFPFPNSTLVKSQVIILDFNKIEKALM